MDVEALLEEDEDDVLEDIDMSQPGMSQDLVDFEDMTPVPSPARRETGGVPTPGRAGAPSQANAAPPSVAAPDGNRGVRVPPDALAMDADAVAGEEADAVAAADGGLGGVSRPARPDLLVPDEEMRDQHTFVPLEPEEVRLAERICRRVDEPKKHLVRLLVGAFGAALAEGALRETERAFEADRRRRREKRTTANLRKTTTTTTTAATRRTSDEDDVRKTAEDIDMSDNSRESDPREEEGGSRESDLVYFDPGDGGPPRRRTPGGVFIRVLRSRAPEKEFKAALRRSAEIDKALRKQMEARDGTTTTRVEEARHFCGGTKKRKEEARHVFGGTKKRKEEARHVFGGTKKRKEEARFGGARGGGRGGRGEGSGGGKRREANTAYADDV
jgi:hypothetical protein